MRHLPDARVDIESNVKPPLPQRLRSVNAVGGIAFIIYAFLLIHLSAAVVMWILTTASVPLVLQLLFLPLLLFLAAQGYHLLGWIGHEGFHFALHPHRLTSVLLGIIVSGATVMFFQVGVAVEHWNHHRHTNTPIDPDYRLFARYRNTISRILLTRFYANRIFLKDALRLALGRPLAMDLTGLPFSLKTYQRLAIFNVFCNTAWLAVYAMLAVYVDWLWVIIATVVPMLIANIYSSIRPYMEHAETGTSLRNVARSRTHWLATALYYGNNFHFEHHLYPFVPSYKLPSVHRYLLDVGWIDKTAPVFEHRFLSAYRWVKGKFQYGVSVGEYEGPS